MKELAKYLDKRAIQINAILEMPADTYDFDTYHILRIEIKKLKFFIGLIKFCDNNFKEKKILRPFVQIFKYAGQVRNFHIEMDVLKKYSKLDLFSKYKNQLLKKQQRGEKKFFLFIGQLNNALLKESFINLQLFSKSVSENDVENYLKKQKDVVEQYYSKVPLQTEELHELRKTLKKIYYAENVLSERQSHKKLSQKSLSDVLGKWHDNLLIIEHLENALNSKKINQEESLFLKNIYVNLVFKTDSYLKIINNKIEVLKEAQTIYNK